MPNSATPSSTSRIDENSTDQNAISHAAPVAAAPKFTEEPVVYIHHWNEGLMSLRIHRDAAYGFVPGQFARIGLKKEDGEVIWRAYSIVSAPHEAFLEFFLVIVPTGEFSSRVAKLKLGDTMLVEKQSQGFLTADRFKDGRDLWLMATGTGLAPYISMVRDHVLWQQFENIVIVLSVRERSDLGYTEELKFLADNSPRPGSAKLQFVTTLTRDKPASKLDGTLSGRINALIESGELERAASLPLSDEHSRFMLCGNPEMVEGMRALLKSRGFRMNRKLEPGHIIVENYW
jgi:ferredoxin/flavodoxin---NADP+ reductase